MLRNPTMSGRTLLQSSIKLLIRLMITCWCSSPIGWGWSWVKFCFWSRRKLNSPKLRVWHVPDSCGVICGKGSLLGWGAKGEGKGEAIWGRWAQYGRFCPLASHNAAADITFKWCFQTRLGPLLDSRAIKKGWKKLKKWFSCSTIWGTMSIL